jgi:hypothetical protein
VSKARSSISGDYAGGCGVGKGEAAISGARVGLSPLGVT